MKKLLRLGVLCALLVAALCVSVFAEKSDNRGIVINGAKTDANTALTPQTAAGVAVAAPTAIDGKNVYKGAELLKVDYTGTASTEYLVFLVKTGELPTEDTLLYINQFKSDGDGKVSFVLNPKAYSLVNGQSYDVMLCSTAKVQIAEFSYYAEYFTGDGNDDGSIDAKDASFVLQKVAGKANDYRDIVVQSCDVNNDSSVDAKDASFILQKIAKGTATFSELFESLGIGG